jgi:hypothetical protein
VAKLDLITTRFEAQGLFEADTEQVLLGTNEELALRHSH